MSSSRSLVINCGASHLAGGVFNLHSSGDLVLEDFFSADLDYDYSQDEGWVAATITALRDQISQKKISGDVNLILPGFQILPKIVKVPHVDVTKQAQTIAYEAQQKIPFPLSDTEAVWDHHVIGDDGVEMEVLVTAQKIEGAEFFCEQVSHLGLRPVAVAPTAGLDFNAFRHADPSETDDVLLINIGARTTTLNFITADDSFLRSVNFGGNSFTQNLADNLGKTFSVAETLKVRYGTGGEEAPPQVVQARETFMKRLGTEITRSVASYRSAKGGRVPSKVFLTGRGSLLPGLAEFLATKLRVPAVEYFDSTANLSFAPNIDTDHVRESCHQLNEMVGFAACSIVPKGVSLNLLPPTIGAKLAFKRKKPFLVLAAASLAIAGVFPVLHYNALAAKHESDLKALNGRVAPLEAANSEIEATGERIKDVQEDIENLTSLVRSKSNWINFLVDMQARMKDKYAWLQALEVQRETVEERKPASSGGLFSTGTTSAGEEGVEEAPVVRRPSLKLRITGLMMDPDNPVGRVSEDMVKKVNDLLDDLKGSEFIGSIADTQFNFDKQGLLQFTFTLEVNPEKRL